MPLLTECQGSPLPGGRFLFLSAGGGGRGGAAHMDAASHPYHVILISTKLLFQFNWCSTDWIQVLFPRLHQFFRKFGKIFGSMRQSLIFFRQIRTVVA